MSKPKIILITVGGVIALATIALVVLILMTFSDKATQVEELDVVRDNAGRLVRLPIYPGIAGVRAFESNRTDFAAWTADARALAARGDKSFERTTSPAFKTFLIDEARRLSELPGAVEGKLVKPDFAFGFAEYISGGVMPKEADLPRLQREWYDVTTVIEALAVTGVTEIVDVTMQGQQKTEEEDTSKPRKNKRKAKAKVDAAASSAPNVTRFSVVFKARAQGIVNAVNAFASSPRFIVVDELNFLHETDELQAALDGDKKEEGTSSRRGSRRRRNSSAAESSQSGFGASTADGAASQTNAVRVVSDPAKAQPFKVSMTFSVYDFRTKENGASNEGNSEKTTKKEAK